MGSEQSGSVCAPGSCEWCGCTFRRPSDVMRHRCAAMQEAEDDNRRERERLRAQAEALPLRIALCPEHAPEFYYPLAEGEGLTCPQCSLTMVVYVRSRLPEEYRS